MNKTRPNKSKLFEVTVTDIGIQGDGIANGADGRYFVPYSAPGDQLSVTLTKARKDSRFAKIERINTAGKDRIEPACPHFGICGGCALQHVGADTVASTKRGFITNALARQNLPTGIVQETINIAPGLRRRARFAIHKAKRIALGFYAPRSRQVIDVEACPAVRPAIAALIAPLRQLAESLRAIKGEASVQVSESETGIDLLLETRAESDLSLEDREMLAQFANRYDLARLAWQGPQGPEPVAQRQSPRYRFGSATVTPPPNAFLQPSLEGERVIVSAACEALAGATRIADLYAGCGALTFPFSSIATTHAFEGDADMIATIQRAAGEHPVTATARDLARMPLRPDELAAFDSVVFDPPRAGAKSQADMLAQSSVPRIVAISCNPGTLARDLRLLVDGGYRIESILPIDQFPWSPHIEAVAILHR